LTPVGGPGSIRGVPTIGELQQFAATPMARFDERALGPDA
jgi:hypothetical protein